MVYFGFKQKNVRSRNHSKKAINAVIAGKEMVLIANALQRSEPLSDSDATTLTQRLLATLLN